jgi:hypothetical protein
MADGASIRNTSAHTAGCSNAQVCPDRAGIADTVAAAVVQPRKWRGVVASAEYRVAKMDLVAAESDASRRRRHDGPRLFLPVQRGDGRKQAEPLGFPAGRLHACGIANRSPHHLIAAADADDHRAAAMLLEHPVCQTRLTQPQEIGHRVLAAWQDDEIVAVRGRRRDPVCPRQQTKVGRIRELRKADDGHPRTWRRQRRRPRLQCQAVLGVQLDVGCVGEDAKAARRRVLLEDAHALVEERHVAAEFVDDKPPEQRALVGGQKVGGADHGCEYAASLDVGDQQPRRANPGDETEVHQIVLAQIQLAHATSALDDDDVETARQILVRLEHLRAQLAGVRVVLARGQRFPHAPIHHDLAQPVAARFQEDRVHRRLRLEPARFSLCHLCPANLAAGQARVRIVRHVLRFERRHRHTLASQPRADRRRHPTLAGVG